ncbi:hypothetical protein BDQ17DRAFT_1410716 [Cyathus striatus]|nr:hypothetical protein BDQ17DRAFT_1410716 [Cyathus striatus]
MNKPQDYLRIYPYSSGLPPRPTHQNLSDRRHKFLSAEFIDVMLQIGRSTEDVAEKAYEGGQGGTASDADVICKSLRAPSNEGINKKTGSCTMSITRRGKHGGPRQVVSFRVATRGKEQSKEGRMCGKRTIRTKEKGWKEERASERTNEGEKGEMRSGGRKYVEETG